MFENPRRGRQARNFYNKCSENSRSQIVFQTDIFRKLSLGAPVMFTLHGMISFTPQRESYQIGFPFTHKNGDLDTISVTHYKWDRFYAILFVQCEFLFRPWRLKKVSRSED